MTRAGGDIVEDGGHLAAQMMTLQAGGMIRMRLQSLSAVTAEAHHARAVFDVHESPAVVRTRTVREEHVVPLGCVLEAGGGFRFHITEGVDVELPDLGGREATLRAPESAWVRALLAQQAAQGLPEPKISLKREIHLHEEHVHRSPGPAITTAASLATAIATAGSGGPLAVALGAAKDGVVAAMASAGISGLAAGVVGGTVQHNGNLGRGLRQSVRRDALRGLVIQMATAGAMRHLEFTQPATSFAERVHEAAVRMPIATMLDVMIAREDPHRALRTGLLHGVVDVGAGTLAHEIGGLYTDKTIGYVGHKALHAGLGALGGAVLDHHDPLRGALAGGLGALIAEIGIEATAPDAVAETHRHAEDIRAEKPWLAAEQVSKESIQRYADQLRTHRHIWNVSATLAAGLAGNAHVGTRTSATAMDNNFVFTALALAGTAMTLYEIAEAGYREGATGAARVAGQAAAFALVGGAAVKGVVKIGGKLYAAVGPRLIELSRPMLQRMMAGGLGETIGRTMVRVGHPRGEFLGNVHTQGMSFEDYVGRMFRSQDRLPPNFKTFDFFHRPTGSAISVKTMDTLTPAKLANPRQVYYSLKRNIDAVRGFTHYRLKSPDSGVRRILSARDVSNRVVYLGIPKLTRSEQIAQIQKAIRYGREQGVQLRVFKLE